MIPLVEDNALTVGWDWLTDAVTIASLTLLGLHWFEGALHIWYPRRTPAQTFWSFWDKLIQTVEYVAFSRQAWGRRADSPYPPAPPVPPHESKNP